MCIIIRKADCYAEKNVVTRPIVFVACRCLVLDVGRECETINKPTQIDHTADSIVAYIDQTGD